MVPASAPRWPRARLWRLLPIVLGAAWPLTAWGQAGDPPAAKESAQGAPAAEAEAQPAPEQPAEPPDFFLDPKAQGALANTFETLFANKGVIRIDQAAIDRMARGQASVDPLEIERFLQVQVKELTDHANINALLVADAGNTKSQAIEKATERLMDPLLVPASPATAGFRSAYTRELLKVMPDLLKNHLFARTEAMIVLSKTGDEQALDTFVAQLNDPSQVMMVKLLAAVGLTNIVQGGKRAIDSATAAKAAKSLSDFLNREPETFWMAQVRALEALGALRQASGSVLQGKGEMASTALKFLADAKVRPDVRARASWALGMMQFPPAGPKLNFGLVVYHVGRAAADLGELAADATPGRAAYLAGLLVYQFYNGLHGEPGVRGAGLVNQTNLGTSQTFAREVETLVGKIAAATIDLSRSVPSQLSQKREQVRARVNDLKALLAKSAPKDFQLVPGGPTFPAAVAQVAEGK